MRIDFLVRRLEKKEVKEDERGVRCVWCLCVCVTVKLALARRGSVGLPLFCFVLLFFLRVVPWLGLVGCPRVPRRCMVRVLRAGGVELWTVTGEEAASTATSSP